MKQKEWPWVMALSAGGALDSVYLLLYQTKKIKHLACPVFGNGCEQVVDSPAAFQRGIPDAVFGLLGYSAAGLTAAALTRASEERKKPLAGVAIAGAVGAVGLAAYLTYAQPKKTGAWCFWCLTSAVISSAMAVVTLSGARKVFGQQVCHSELSEESLAMG